MHNLKLQYFKSSGKWYTSEGYHNDESRVCVKDVLYEDLESTEQYQRRQKVYNEGLKVLEDTGLAYLIVLDNDYLGYPMMIIHE